MSEMSTIRKYQIPVAPKLVEELKELQTNFPDCTFEDMCNQLLQMALEIEKQRTEK